MWLKRKFFWDFLNFQLSSTSRKHKKSWPWRNLCSSVLHFCTLYLTTFWVCGFDLQLLVWVVALCCPFFSFFFFTHFASAALGTHLTWQPNSLSMLLAAGQRNGRNVGFLWKTWVFLTVLAAQAERPWRSFQITLILSVYSSECHWAPLPD